jgi:hypothetical protein
MDIKTYNKFILIGSRCGNVNSQVRKYIEDNSLSNYVVKMIINPPKKYNDMMDILNGCEYVAHTSKIINQDNIYFEIVKKYDCNLRQFQNKLNVTCINEIINYIILIQIELFDKYGFIWNKLSLSNILVNKNDNLVKELYISDLDNSCILDPKYGFIEYYQQNNLLINGDSTNLVIKIYKTFLLGISLLANKIFMINFLEKTKEIKQKYYLKSKEIFNVYKSNLLDDTYQIYKKELFIMINQMIQECWNVYNELIKIENNIFKFQTLFNNESIDSNGSTSIQ